MNPIQNQTNQVPHSPDSERAVIGCLLLDGKFFAKAREALKPAYFYLPSHRLCYEAALNLEARGLAVDPVQMAEELRAAGNLEKVGGLSYITAYLDYAIHSDFESHCERVIEFATRRMFWVLTTRAAASANSAQPVEEILDGLRELLIEAESRIERVRPSDSGLATSWAEFESESFVAGERIAFAVERGEAALVNALPNAGKTTVSLNAAISLAAGRTFAPVVTEARERRVLYVDGETRRARLQRDLRTMTAGFSREESIAVGRNLHIICEAEIGKESLALTRADHWQKFAKAALQTKPDFIVIDTMVSLCPVFNENDNAEQQRKIWTPLQKLARDCNAAVLVLHHVGKRSEDSRTPESVYRGRGASAGGGFARAVWLLIPDPVTPGLSTLKCVKAKGEVPQETRLQLGENRWFVPMIATTARPKSLLERIIEFVTTEKRVAEIEAALKPDFARRTVEGAISEAVELGKLKQIKRGIYGPASAFSAQPALASFAEDAEGAEGNASEAENQSPPTVPHVPHSPIGSAESAETATINKSNDLNHSQGEPRKQSVRKGAESKTEPQNSVSARSAHPMASAERAETPKRRRISL